MAKLTEHKARKVYKCYKCGKVINIGDRYKKININFTTPKTVCLKCPIKRTDLTTSAYLKELYYIQDKDYDSTIECYEDLQANAIDELETLRDETESKIDNMPESLQESPVAEMLQNRYDSLDDAINQLVELESEFPEYNIKETKYENNIKDFLNNIKNCIDNNSLTDSISFYAEDYDDYNTEELNNLLVKVALYLADEDEEEDYIEIDELINLCKNHYGNTLSENKIVELLYKDIESNYTDLFETYKTNVDTALQRAIDIINEIPDE